MSRIGTDTLIQCCSEYDYGFDGHDRPEIWRGNTDDRPKYGHDELRHV